MDTLLYPKTTGLLGELSEPWRLENDLKPMAQEYLDAAAICVRLLSPRLTVAGAYDLYAAMLCDAIDINLGNRIIVPANVFLMGTEDYPELQP